MRTTRLVNAVVTNLSSGIELPVSIENGGTGTTTLTSGNILIGNGTDAITSIATLPITSGGTGATTASDALSNLGLPVETGNWSPTLTNRGYDSDPTYTVNAGAATYTKMGKLVFLMLYMKVTITNTGGSTGYCGIGGLPFTNGGQRASLSVYEFDSSALGTADIVRCGIAENANTIKILDRYGVNAMKWKTCSNANISMSGFYTIN